MNVSGTEIDLTPTKGMRSEAAKFKKWRDEGRKGGTRIAAVRATQISVSYTHLPLPTTPYV